MAVEFLNTEVGWINTLFVVRLGQITEDTYAVHYLDGTELKSTTAKKYAAEQMLGIGFSGP